MPIITYLIAVLMFTAFAATALIGIIKLTAFWCRFIKYLWTGKRF